MKVEDTSCTSLQEEWKSINCNTHTNFLYYIFIIIIICSLVFHIVIIVIVITSCDNLKQIKQYCLFFVELSSQLVAQALFTSDCKLAFFYKSGSPYPGPKRGPGQHNNLH